MPSPSPLTLLTATGAIEVAPRTLVVAVDDTGNEAFPAGTKCFGLGGCAFMAGDYGWLIDEPWKQLKASHFADASGPLHAARLRNVSATQAEALGAFFRDNPFFRFAIMATESVELTDDVPLINAVGALLMDRALDMVRSVHATGIIVVAEHSDRLNRSVFAALGGRRVSIDGIESDVSVGFLPKSVGASLLEVADFVIHTAGAQLRTDAEGRIEPVRRDFKAVFWRVPSHLTHHNIVLRARQIDA
jgi:hypothetical protein